MIDTKELRTAVEAAGLNAISTQEVLELLDRLEAVRREHLFNEQRIADLMAELNSVDHENAELRAKISDLTINVEYLDNLKKSYEELIGELQDERDALRVKIEAMEQQEPVSWADAFGEPFRQKREIDGVASPLYALPGAQPAWSSQAVLDITAERRRQIEVECWTPEHDDEHRAGEMAKAAACYALVSAGFNPDAAGSMWPWRRRWWKPSDKRRDLIKAGALILAEVERLDRTAEVGRKMK